MASRPGSELPALGGRGEGWVVVQVALAGLLVLCELLGPRWPESAARVTAATGVVLGTAGILLFVAGGGSLGRALTPFPKPSAQASLREGGAYRLVRHPMYGGVLLAITGWSLAASPLGLAATALVAFFLELKSRREEAWLMERYPSYGAYRQRVRWKLVPGIR